MADNQVTQWEYKYVNADLSSLMKSVKRVGKQQETAILMVF